MQLHLNPGFFTRFVEKLNRFRKQRLTQYILYPVIVSLPSTLVQPALRWAEAIGKKTAPHPIEQYVSQFILEHQWPILVIGAIWIIIVGGIIKYIAALIDSRLRSIDFVDYQFLQVALSKIVKAKSRRFGGCVLETQHQRNLDASWLFNKITMPDVQIHLLTAGIQSVIAYLDNKYFNSDAVNVGLLALEKNNQYRWFDPQQDDLGPIRDTHLTLPKGPALKAANARKTVVIDSIAKEIPGRKVKLSWSNNKDFQFPSELEGAEGSLLCYPVIYPQCSRPPYIIVLYCSSPGYFESTQLFEWIAKEFSDRILLEHSLLILKDKCRENAE